eukprot:jgi/Botrbrau1/6160/Bobra.0344s0001.1
MIQRGGWMFPKITMKWIATSSIFHGSQQETSQLLSSWKQGILRSADSRRPGQGDAHHSHSSHHKDTRTKLNPIRQRTFNAWGAVAKAVELREGGSTHSGCKFDEVYEPVIGIECHIQLNTATKAFCSCKNEYGGGPNEFVCPVCMGHPGTLPVLNAEMVHKAVMTGLALSATIAVESTWDRKQYFYPDLPKGYQITQYDTPIVSHGYLDILLPNGGNKQVSIVRAHLEEDAGKLSHAGAKQLSGSEYSTVDYNRAGVPLLEIVSGPDLRSGGEAAAYGEELRRVVTYLGVSLANMQDGGMRL